MIKEMAISVALVFLAGCSSFSIETPEIERRIVTVVLTDGDKFEDPKVRGMAGWYKQGDRWFCHIKLKEYPYYLGHEMRHCFEGYWHDERPNGEDF